jgi:hypothetical protein
MTSLDPVPKKGEHCWFYTDDRVDLKHEHEAIVVEAFSFWDSGFETIARYDDVLEDVIDEPVMDLWIIDQDETFWILDEETDYIIKINVPELTARPIYVARTVDGGWHSFETVSPKEFGILDVTGELHKKVHSK